MGTHSTSVLRAPAVTALLIGAAGCASNKPAITVDQERAKKADVVLIIKDADDTGGSKFHTWTAKTVKVLKAPRDAQIDDDLRFAMYGWEPEIPNKPVILYAVYFDETAKKDLRAIGWDPAGK